MGKKIFQLNDDRSLVAIEETGERLIIRPDQIFKHRLNPGFEAALPQDVKATLAAPIVERA